MVLVNVNWSDILLFVTNCVCKETVCLSELFNILVIFLWMLSICEFSPVKNVFYLWCLCWVLVIISNELQFQLSLIRWTNHVYDVSCMTLDDNVRFSITSVFSLMRCMTSVIGMTYIVLVLCKKVHGGLTVHSIEGLFSRMIIF